MSDPSDLEKRVEDDSGPKDALGNSLEEKAYVKYDRIKTLKNYVVDTTSSWVYWTPLMAMDELFISGMDGEEVLKSRLVAIGMGLIVARPQAIFRQYWADLWKADGDSSKLKKFIVDTTAQMAWQAPLYSTILYFSGVSWDEGTTALATGLVIGTVFGRFYGYFQDKWRKLWGTKPTLDK